MNGSSTCHCGNDSPFEQCCGRFLSGQQQPETAEQLMRSRYSAFCEQQVDYLIETLHENQRSPDDAEALKASMEGCQWLSLKVLDTQAGAIGDSEGEVEFAASYLQNQRPGLLHERSRFVKEDDRWYYVDGVLYETPPVDKLGRNDPCWCGSGKKFKKCHG